MVATGERAADGTTSRFWDDAMVSAPRLDRSVDWESGAPPGVACIDSGRVARDRPGVVDRSAPGRLAADPAVHVLPACPEGDDEAAAAIMAARGARRRSTEDS